MSVRPIIPAEAFCAVGPDGKIDIDLVRRNRASAQHAAGAVNGTTWAALASQGWQVIDVIVLPRGSGMTGVPSAPEPTPTDSAVAEVERRKPAPRKPLGLGVLRFGESAKAREFA